MRKLTALAFGAAALAFSFAAQAQQAAAPPNLYQFPSQPETVMFGQLEAQLVSPLSQLIGTRAYNWISAGAAPQAGVAMGYYIPCCRDPVTTAASPTPHTYSWYLANHPNWLMYLVQPADITTTTVGASAASGSNTIVTVAVIAGIAVNQQVLGTGVNAGAQVVSFNPTTGTVTISGTMTIAGSTSLEFVGSNASTTTTASASGSNIIAVAASATVPVGSAAVGTGIPNLTFVTAAPAAGAAGNVTLSNNVTVTNSQKVNFYFGEQDRPTDLIFNLNFADTAVQQYMIANATANGANGGFPYISMDNVNVANSSLLLGHFGGAVAGCAAGPPACGGIFVSQYPQGEYDPNYLIDLLNYTSNFHTAMNTIGVGLAANIKSSIIIPQGAQSTALNFNFDLYESFFIAGCDGSGNTIFRDNTNSLWYSALTLTTPVSSTRPTLMLGYICNHQPEAATNPEISWGEGNYLLTRGPQSMMEFDAVGSASSAGRFINYPSTMTFDIGAPSSPVPNPNVPNSSGGCYERTFTKGMVEVWPYPTGSCTYTVPTGHTWTDNFGNSVSTGLNTLSPDTSTSTTRANAIILLRTN